MCKFNGSPGYTMLFKGNIGILSVIKLVLVQKNKSPELGLLYNNKNDDDSQSLHIFYDLSSKLRAF